MNRLNFCTWNVRFRHLRIRWCESERSNTLCPWWKYFLPDWMHGDTHNTRDSFWPEFWSFDWAINWTDHMKLTRKKFFLHFLFAENPKSNTTPCWPRPASITTVEITLNWVPLAVDTSVCARCPSPIQEIPISFVHCQKLKVNSESEMGM